MSSSPLAPKLDFVLKVLSMSRGRLASELGVDKSAVGRWVTGVTAPSAHNLDQLTALVGSRVEGFTSLDWDKDLDGLAAALGVGRREARAADAGDGLPATLVEQSLLTTRLRGSAYQGFFRSTRPYAQHPGLFVHDAVVIRPGEGGHLQFEMIAAGVHVAGRVMLLQNQLFCIGGELTSGAFVFAILNGVSTVQAGVLDGLLLYCALDPGRTPTATPAVLERIGDLCGSQQDDDARFAALGAEPAVAPEGTVSAAIRDHLVRDIGPARLAAGGDWLLQAPLIRSLARGLGTPLP